jgi:AcrR family transcriptional regulator
MPRCGGSPTPTGAEHSSRPVGHPGTRQTDAVAASRAPIGLDAETIIDTAIRLIDELGAKAVTVRRLAGELNVTAPVIYWHVGSKDELWDAVIERVFSQLPMPAETARSWQEQVRRYMSDAWTHLLAHPGVLELAHASRLPWSGSAERWGVEGYWIMKRAGFDDANAAAYGQALMLQIIGMARLEASMRTDTPVLESWTDERNRAVYRVKPDLLPAEMPDGLKRMASLDVHAHRELMIEMTIAGLRSALRRRAQP